METVKFLVVVEVGMDKGRVKEIESWGEAGIVTGKQIGRAHV